MMLIESSILLKNHVNVIYAKTLHYIFISTVYKHFKSVFQLYLRQTKILMPGWFDEFKEVKKFWGTFTG